MARSPACAAASANSYSLDVGRIPALAMLPARAVRPEGRRPPSPGSSHRRPDLVLRRIGPHDAGRHCAPRRWQIPRWEIAAVGDAEVRRFVGPATRDRSAWPGLVRARPGRPAHLYGRRAGVALAARRENRRGREDAARSRAGQMDHPGCGIRTAGRRLPDPCRARCGRCRSSGAQGGSTGTRWLNAAAPRPRDRQEPPTLGQKIVRDTAGGLRAGRSCRQASRSGACRPRPGVRARRIEGRRSRPRSGSRTCTDRGSTTRRSPSHALAQSRASCPCACVPRRHQARGYAPLGNDHDRMGRPCSSSAA